MQHHQHPQLHADQSNREARSLAGLLLFAAENCDDADFARLRDQYITLLYLLIEKSDEAAEAIEQLYQPEKGALQ